LIVADTSAIVDALIRLPVNRALERRLADERLLHAPHLIDVEFLHALRGLVLRRVLTGEQASVTRSNFARLQIRRYPHWRLSERIWSLKNNFTACDATFLALAEALSVPLITTDARLAAQHGGHDVRIELF
jgi:predicted nucleic acid-binding protein